MLKIKSFCKQCGQEVVFMSGNTLDFDTAQNEEYGLEPSDETSIRLICPKCSKNNDFALIVEQDEILDFEEQK